MVLIHEIAGSTPAGGAPFNFMVERTSFLYVSALVPQIAEKKFGFISNQPIFTDASRWSDISRLVRAPQTNIYQVGGVTRGNILYFTGEVDLTGEFTRIGQAGETGWVAIVEPIGARECIRPSSDKDLHNLLVSPTLLGDFVEDSPKALFRADGVLVKEIVAYCAGNHNKFSRKRLIESVAELDTDGELTPFCDEPLLPIHGVCHRLNYHYPIVKFKIENGELLILDKIPKIKEDANWMLVNTTSDPFIR